MDKNNKLKIWVVLAALILAVGMIAAALILRGDKTEAPAAETPAPTEAVPTPTPVPATPKPDDCSTLGHNWIPADCTTPETCARCGLSRGSALGHSWSVNGNVKSCSRCGEYELIPTPVPTPKPTTKSASGEDVDIFENDTLDEIYSVAVSSSVHENARSRAITCVERLREAGYNAFIVHARDDDKDRYTIYIGVFSSAASAQALAEELQSQPAITGTASDHAYATKCHCPNTYSRSKYENPYW